MVGQEFTGMDSGRSSSFHYHTRGGGNVGQSLSLFPPTSASVKIRFGSPH